MAKAMTKATAEIRKPAEMKVNILPIFGSLIHDHAYEGPCRFGDKDELTHEFDERATAMGFAAFKEKLAAKFGGDPDVELLEPLCMACSDEFHFKWEQFDEIDEVIGKTDVIFLYGNPMPRLVREIAARYTQPLMILTNSGAITVSEMSDLINRGRADVYGCIDWNEVVSKAHCFKVVKALKNTRVLKMIRHESDLYLTDDFKCGDRFGVLATSINMHEMMDQLHTGDGTGNANLPLRTVYNLTEEDNAEAERIADELIADADECWMERDMVVKSVRYNVLTRKLMAHFNCNAFTAQCKECCATTRINEEQVTYCLGHSLNNELGIASACEGDMNALNAITISSCLTHKAPYQSNTTPVVMEDGEIISKNWFSDQPCTKQYENQLYCTWHAVPNRYMDGYDADPTPYRRRAPSRRTPASAPPSAASSPTTKEKPSRFCASTPRAPRCSSSRAKWSAARATTVSAAPKASTSRCPTATACSMRSRNSAATPPRCSATTPPNSRNSPRSWASKWCWPSKAAPTCGPRRCRGPHGQTTSLGGDAWNTTSARATRTIF